MSGPRVIDTSYQEHTWHSPDRLMFNNTTDFFMIPGNYEAQLAPRSMMGVNIGGALRWQKANNLYPTDAAPNHPMFRKDYDIRRSDGYLDSRNMYGRDVRSLSSLPYNLPAGYSANVIMDTRAIRRSKK